ncbi:IclR family transcriptional regulator [Pikeienuella piscinae]|uniref:IclR family transcriptional regulator n=1 Tax=Pikeienuella piscinae TaxID=2748098 RepID=A0A7L5C0X4_9RHOB|nr:IclR family transcriptional regulator [Pikeienuella piscinae]QIE56758.1 IclR family transcriptional regulator [Pikeienuella piscinae]
MPALFNGIRIVEALNRHGSTGASLAELSSALGITKSHCHAILKTLTHSDWLQFDDRAKTYRLGAGLLASCSSLRASPELKRIRERLAQLVVESGFSCVLTQPQKDRSFIVIDNLSNDNQVLVSYAIGSTLPYDSPAQMRAFLAWRPEAEQKRLLARRKIHKYTRHTITTPERLIAELAATRVRGFSRSVGEHFEGMLAYGLPIFSREGKVAYIFCLAGFVSQIEEYEARVTSAMKRAARDIHDSIMGEPPADFP